MTIELQPGGTESASRPPAPRQLTWRERRWQRRRRRIWFEELLGWILVPIIVIGGYWLATIVFDLLGTSPASIIEAAQSLLASQ